MSQEQITALYEGDGPDGDNGLDYELFGTTALTAYESDFSVDTDNWTNGNLHVLAGNIDSILGEDDCLQITTADTTGFAAMWSDWNEYTFKDDTTYFVSFDYYFPAANTEWNSTKVWINGGTGDDSGTTTGSWIGYSTTLTTGASTKEIRIYTEENNNNTQGDASGDYFYVKNFLIIEQ